MEVQIFFESPPSVLASGSWFIRRMQAACLGVLVILDPIGGWKALSSLCDSSAFCSWGTRVLLEVTGWLVAEPDLDAQSLQLAATAGGFPT